MKSDPKLALIEAGTKVFAQVGYSEGKVAEIAKLAKANVAAVNYHFGSKEELFVAVLKSTFAIADEKFPMHGGLAEDAAAEDKLMAFSEALIRRSFEQGPAGNFNKIMSNSIEAPGTPFERVMKEVHSLEVNYLENCLDQLLPEAKPETKRQAKLNCIFLSVMISKAKFAKPMIFEGEPTTEQIENYISLQKKFILNSILTFAN